MCDRTSCAQVHELPQSHCGDNWEGTLFLWLHINYTHLASVRFEHSVCRESLMTTYWITCGNSWTWADDVWLPITGTNESTMNTLYIRAFQIVLRGGRWVSPAGAGESYILLEEKIFLIWVWEPEEWFWTFFKAKNSFI